MRRFRSRGLFAFYARGVRVYPPWLAIGVVLLLTSSAAFSQLDHIRAAARLLDEGQLSKADAEAHQALRNPGTRALGLAMLGTIRLQQSNYEESERFLTQALRLNPDLIGARLTLGDAYLLQHRPVDARRSFQQALARDPSNFAARLHLAKVESSLSNFQRSLDVAKPIESQLRDRDDGLLLLATDYAELGKHEELARLYKEWQRLPEHSPDVSLDFGLVLANHGRPDDAKAILDEAAIQTPPPSAPVALKLAEGYFLVNALVNAEKEFTLALSLDPNCVSCNRGLAQIAEKQGESEKALAYLIQAKKMDPENSAILFEFGKVCLERDLIKDAVPALEKALELRPDNDLYAYTLASADVGQGNLTEAASLLTHLLQKNPQDPSLIYAVGTVYYLEGKFAEAQSSLKRSLDIQPSQVAASYYLGLTYDASGDDEQAVAIFQDLLKRHPEHGLAHVKLGTILLREHKYDEARANLEKAISLLPHSGEAHYQFGLLLRRMGKTSESENEFAQARKLESERTQIRMQLLKPE